MAGRSSQTDVENVLGDMKAALSQRKYTFVKRSKNMQTLASMGLLISDVLRELSSLSYTDYIKGPEPDRDIPGSDDFWIFKKTISGQIIYIKFKVLYQVDGKVTIVSFHIDESVY